LAFRLAKERGIDDVLTWYESLPSDVWSQWLAYDSIEPVGCEWERHAGVMAMLDAIQACLINPNVDKQHRVKPRSMQEFLPPKFYEKAKPVAKKKTLRQQLAVLAKAFGGNYGNNN
jgi:hypothetical protein